VGKAVESRANWLKRGAKEQELLANCHGHNNEMRKLCDFHICTAFEIKRMNKTTGWRNRRNRPHTVCGKCP